MALGDKHAKLSFSGWLWAPDARKRNSLEASVSPRHGGIPLFASPALLTQESLRLLMAKKSQRHEEAVHNVGKKAAKNRTRTEKNVDFPGCCFQARFLISFGPISMPKIPGMRMRV